MLCRSGGSPMIMRRFRAILANASRGQQQLSGEINMKNPAHFYEQLVFRLFFIIFWFREICYYLIKTFIVKLRRYLTDSIFLLVFRVFPTLIFRFMIYELIRCLRQSVKMLAGILDETFEFWFDIWLEIIQSFERISNHTPKSKWRWIALKLMIDGEYNRCWKIKSNHSLCTSGQPKRSVMIKTFAFIIVTTCTSSISIDKEINMKSLKISLIW